MDDEKINLAGNLSKPDSLPNNTHYIGIQSRFEKQEIKKKYDFLGIVSGPEPQRTILRESGMTTLVNCFWRVRYENLCDLFLETQI